jgi:hypothetical protein
MSRWHCVRIDQIEQIDIRGIVLLELTAFRVGGCDEPPSALHDWLLSDSVPGRVFFNRLGAASDADRSARKQTSKSALLTQHTCHARSIPSAV